MVAVLEEGVGAVVDEQLHDFEALLVVDEDGGEVEGGLASLRLQAVHQDGVVLLQELLDHVQRAEWLSPYQHFIAITNSFTTS